MGWEGEEELTRTLAALASAKGTSASRVRNTSAIALKYVKEYKRVVHAVEHFLWKAEPEHRLAGLFTIDAIIRQSRAKNGTKDVFTKRFGQHLSQTLAAVKRVPEDGQLAAKRVINEWLQKGVYSEDDLVHAAGFDYIQQLSHLSERDSPKPNGGSPLHSGVGVGVGVGVRGGVGSGSGGNQLSGAATSQIAGILSLIKKQQGETAAAAHESLPNRRGRESGLLHHPGELHGVRGRIENVDNSQISMRRSQSPMKSRLPRTSSRWGPPPPSNENLPHHGLQNGRGMHGEEDRSHNGADFRTPRNDRNSVSQYDDYSRSKQPRNHRGMDSSDSSHRSNPHSPLPFRNRRDTLDDHSTHHQRDRRDEFRQREGGRPPAPLVVCRQFEKSKSCQYGDTCRFSHGGVGPPHRTFHDSGLDRRDMGGPDSMRSPRHGMNGSGSRSGFSRGERNNNHRSDGGIEREVCRQFQLGRCRFGDSCRRIHTGNDRDHGTTMVGGHPQQHPQQHPNQQQQDRHYHQPDHPYQQTDHPDHHHQQQQDHHPRKQTQPPSQSGFTPVEELRKTKLCTNFPKGKCRFGDTCLFAHSEAEMKPRLGISGMNHPPLPMNPMQQPSPRIGMNQHPMTANSTPNHPHRGDASVVQVDIPAVFPINYNSSNSFSVDTGNEQMNVKPVPPPNENPLPDQIQWKGKGDEEEEEEEQPQFMLEYDDEDGDEEPMPRKRIKTT